MKEKEYFKLVKEAEQRFQRDLEAIKRVWRLSHGGPPPMPRTAKTVSLPVTHTENATVPAMALTTLVEKMKISRIVTDIVLKMDHEFTIHDIAQTLRESHPNVKFQFIYLSSVLMRLRVRGTIKQVGERVGTEPAKYIRA